MTIKRKKEHVPDVEEEEEEEEEEEKKKEEGKWSSKWRRLEKSDGKGGDTTGGRS